MSYSVSFIGKPSKISEALSNYSEKLSGQSKQEYDEALPHLKALVESNVGDKVVQINANGHASFTNGEKTEGHCQVTITSVYGACV